MRLVITLLVTFLQLISAKKDFPPLLCSSTFCSKYVQENKCLSLPDNCAIQNKTHNGIELPSPVPCSCCNYCLANILEGEACATGSIGDPVPSDICGPGLYCDPDLRICKLMSEIGTTDCARKQQIYKEKYAKGTLGYLEVRPICDERGDFAPYKCVPGQTCHCVDKKGNRIYGEMIDNDLISELMHCECSRKYHDAVLVIGKELNPLQHFRCTPNGDYDTLQCIDDLCLCVDSLDGVPTFPYQASVNISLIQNKTLVPCYDENLHEPVLYDHACAQKYEDSLKEVANFKVQGFDWVLNYEFPNCDLDQNFGAVQLGDNEFYCSDPQGEKIENFAIGLTDPNRQEMDCKCARTRWLLGTSKLEKPECCPNGNFKQIQCRRGLCRCVDRDGHQIEKEVPEELVEQLTCKQETMCDFP